LKDGFGHLAYCLSVGRGQAVIAISTIAASCSRDAPSLAITAIPRENAL
jgi:hypothetical protein